MKTLKNLGIVLGLLAVAVGVAALIFYITRVGYTTLSCIPLWFTFGTIYSYLFEDEKSQDSWLALALAGYTFFIIGVLRSDGTIKSAGSPLIIGFISYFIYYYVVRQVRSDINKNKEGKNNG